MQCSPTLAAAIITLNEARHLSLLLASLHWVDEIVVVDGGSHDETVELANRWGCRTAVRPFDCFARQRNHALSLVKSEWVLSVDADERATSNLAREVRQRLNNSRANGYRVPIRSRIFGRRFRFSGTQDDLPVRLFRRAAAHWVGDVHELLRVDGHIAKLDAWLEHETLPDLSTFLSQMRRYTALEAQARVVAGRVPCRHDMWINPAREWFRRLIWKHGWLDGPEGWAFCALSGLSEWVQAVEHRRAWNEQQTAFRAASDRATLSPEAVETRCILPPLNSLEGAT